jgi:hypothetical protein
MQLKDPLSDNSSLILQRPQGDKPCVVQCHLFAAESHVGDLPHDGRVAVHVLQLNCAHEKSSRVYHARIRLQITITNAFPVINSLSVWQRMFRVGGANHGCDKSLIP